MSTGELVPIASGALIGSILASVPPSWRRWAPALVILFGVFATVFTGESAVSWAFVLIDIPLVAVSAAAAFALVRWRPWQRSH